MLHPRCSCSPGLLSPEIALAPGCPAGFSARIWIPAPLAYCWVSCPTETTASSSLERKARKERKREEKHFHGNFPPCVVPRGSYFSSKLWSTDFCLQWKKKVFTCVFKAVVLSPLRVFFPIETGSRHSSYIAELVDRRRVAGVSRLFSVFFCCLRGGLRAAVNEVSVEKPARLHEETQRARRRNFLLAHTHSWAFLCFFFIHIFVVL